MCRSIILAALWFWGGGRVCTAGEQQTGLGSTPSRDEEKPRLGLSAGMGVSYVNAQDLVNYVSSIAGERVPDFKSAVEFFGAFELPVNGPWILKFEYAYLLGTYAVGGGPASGEFTFSAHLPTLVGSYVLVQERTYGVKVGAGLGYHVGHLSTHYSTAIDDFSASGPGMKAEIEANTAFGEDFFAYLGADMRWDFIGNLKNRAGNSPQGGRLTTGPTLHFFSLGAKLGFTYYL